MIGEAEPREKTADPSPLKRFGMTKTQDFYGAAKAAPLQNGARQSFSAACEAVLLQN
jgi:hypothetical protein